MIHSFSRSRKLRDRYSSLGFTLVELLVVVVIIAVLAAIAVPIFLNQKAKAQLSATQATVSTISEALSVGKSTGGTVEVTSTALKVTDGSGAVVTVPLGGLSPDDITVAGLTGTGIVAGTPLSSASWCASTVDAGGNRVSMKETNTQPTVGGAGCSENTYSGSGSGGSGGVTAVTAVTFGTPEWGDLPISWTSTNNPAATYTVEQEKYSVYAKFLKAGGDYITVNGIAVDSSDSVFVTGSYNSSSSVSLDGVSLPAPISGNDVFVVKMDASGTVVWATNIPGDGFNEAGNAIGLDGSGNVYVGGHYSSSTPVSLGTSILPVTAFADAFVAKLSPSGAWQWAEAISGPSDNGVYGVSVTSAGDVFIGGTYSSGSTIDLGAASLPSTVGGAGFVAKLDSAGTWVWATGMDTSGSAEMDGVQFGPSGSVYVSGKYSAAGPAFFGAATLPMTDNTDGFVAKFDSTGAWVWATGLKGSGEDNVKSIATGGPSGALYLTGTYNSASPVTLGSASLPATVSYDGFVAKMDGSGSWVWANGIQGDGDDNIYNSAVAVDSAENVYATGEYNSSSPIVLGAVTLPVHVGNNAFIAKLNSAGAWQWANTSVGDNDETGTSIAMGPSGDVYSVGNYTGYIPFQPTSVPASYAPNQGGYVAKFTSYDGSVMGSWTGNYTESSNSGWPIVTPSSTGALIYLPDGTYRFKVTVSYNGETAVTGPTASIVIAS